MITTNSLQYGRVAGFALLQRATGSHRSIRGQKLSAGFRDLGIWSPMGTETPGCMTPWRNKNYASLQPSSLVIMHTGSSLGGAGRIAAVVNSGILVRGGTELPLAASLVATAYVASVLERRSKAGGIIGAPLLCFGIFCVLSNLHLAPATHALYELCWSFLLPLSLSIIILGNPAIAKTSASSAMPNRSAGIIGPMRRVGLVFAIGAAGSLAGVGVAFRLANAGWGGALMLPRETAAKIAGAVAATYIGGSVNLFAVAAAVGLMGTTSAGGASLFGALAATDIFLMALYFSGLVAAHKTPLLHRVFPASDCNDDDPLGGIQQTVAPIDNTRSAAIYSGGTGITSGRVTAIARTFSMLALGSVVCVMGNALAKISPLPGTATMVVTLLTVGTTRLLSRLAPHWHAEMSRKAPVMAAVLLNVFFASVGASGRWAQVVGVAPAIFAFASVALGVHVIVVAAGTALLNRFCGAGLGIDDMIVASNANIGGPSTAATFAGLIGQDALIVPAAVWGTVGYAIATTLGVGVWVLLR